MAESTSVRLQAGPIARITMDRPPLNVLDIAALGELAGALEAATGDSVTKVVVLEAAGKAFCAGVDVRDHDAERVADMLATFGGVIDVLRKAPVPVIAAVHGAALGGGCEVAMACDLVLASEDARFGQPEIRLGVFPPTAAALLPRLVGRQRALDLVLTGRTLTAREAAAIGLVALVFASADFEEGVAEYAGRLAALSRPVLMLTKQAVSQGLEGTLEDALAAADHLYVSELMNLHDPHEGLAAFLEKREPVWSDS